MDPIKVVIEDRTKALNQTDLSTICIFDTTKDITEQIVEKTDGINGFGAEDAAYKELEKIMGNTIQKVVIIGVDMSAEGTVVADELNKIESGFLYIVSTSRDTTEMKAINAWAASNMRIFLGTTAKDITKEIAGTLSDDMNSDYGALFAHPGDSEGVDVCFASGAAGLCAPKEIGSYTWANKSPNLIAKKKYDNITETAMLAKNINVFTESLGRYFVSDGKTTSGSYIDITEGKLWLYHKTREELTLYILNKDKVSYDDSGINAFGGKIRKVCEAAVSQGIIQADYEIELPQFDEILEVDIVNRELPYVYVNAVVLGSVHKASVKYALALTKEG